MQINRFSLVLKLLLVLALLVACQSDGRLMAFASQGCANYAASIYAGDVSLAPESNAAPASNWCDCCIEHDIAYWRGGTSQQHDQADARLRDCVARKTSDQALANQLYQDLRSGGSAYFFDGYRWAYGWSDERQYRALEQHELLIANRLLLDYFKAGQQICL
ncbi:MAG: hypothetical protein HKO71_03225 [Pseudomonadales bacterium]|nr:hypothetical protein [Pseudomonadales bacterium]